MYRYIQALFSNYRNIALKLYKLCMPCILLAACDCDIFLGITDFVLRFFFLSYTNSKDHTHKPVHRCSLISACSF